MDGMDLAAENIFRYVELSRRFLRRKAPGARGRLNPGTRRHCCDRVQKWTISKTMPIPIRIWPVSNTEGWFPLEPASTKSRPTIVAPRPIAVSESFIPTLLLIERWVSFAHYLIHVCVDLLLVGCTPERKTRR
jgi:hypothetical protein